MLYDKRFALFSLFSESGTFVVVACRNHDVRLEQHARNIFMLGMVQVTWDSASDRILDKWRWNEGPTYSRNHAPKLVPLWGVCGDLGPCRTLSNTLQPI